MKPNKTVMTPVISMARDVGNTLVNAIPIATKNKMKELVKKNIPTKKRIKATIKEKRLLLDCCNSALTSSITANKISTKEVTVYGSL
jgi:hypothetical protein